MELTATLFDATTGERIGPATDLHLKARAASAGVFRPGLILVDDVLDVVESGCREAIAARAVFVVEV